MLSVPRSLLVLVLSTVFALSFPKPNITMASAHARDVRPVSCANASTVCAKVMLAILNQDRAQHRLAPLRLNRAQTFGVGRCLGSDGHSRAMARTGQIWHINPSFPRASFPNNICGSYGTYGQNVGSEQLRSVPTSLRDLDSLMMTEPHSRRFCSSSHFNHACNILDPSFHTVGIGVLVSGGSIWLTEDFTS